MARPHKQTVDYFPHYCNSGRTLFILQSKFGNDGYAFWFKLLSLLGKTEGHAYDYNDPADWQFLIAETHVSEDTAVNIIATIVDLGAVDGDLAQNKIIWVQNFVNNLADVYKRRQIDLPQRPGQEPYRQTSQNDDIIDANLAAINQCYEDNIGLLTPILADQLKDISDTYPEGWFQKAVSIACEKNARNLKYITGILKRWLVDGVDSGNEKPSKHERTIDYKD